MFYEKRISKKDKVTRQPIYSNEDTTLVAVVFTLKNGQKSGNATWYNFGKEKEVLQTGQFKDGVKHGFWTVHRKKGTETYKYVEGKLSGQKTYLDSKNQITSVEWYENGLKNGWATTYYKGKKQLVRSRAFYKNSNSSSQEMYYNKKGELTYNLSDTFTDNITIKRFENGVLTYTETRIDSLGFSWVKRYYINGKLESQTLLIEPSYYVKSYNDRKNNIKKLPKPNWWEYHNLSRAIDGRTNCVSHVSYNKSGEVVSSYDIRSTEPGDTLYEYNAKGQLIKSLWLDREHDNFFNTINFYKKSTLYKTYNLSGKQIAFERVNHKGDTTEFEYSPFYLSETNKNKKGFVESKKEIDGNKTRYQYNLLHTKKGIETKLYKGQNLSDVLFFKHLPEPSSKIDVVWIEYDDKKRFSVEHLKTYDLVDYEKSQVSHPYQTKIIKQPFQSLNKLYDTLEYRIIHERTPYTGEVKFKKKHTSFRKLGRRKYKLKYDITKIKTKYQKYYDTTLIVKTYTNSFGYISSSNKTRVVNGEVESIKTSYTLKASYNDNFKTGEGDDIDGFEGNYVRGQKHGLYKSSTQFDEYFQGMRHGMTMKLGYYGNNKRYNRQIDYKANFTLDTLHGMFQSFNSPGVVGQSVVFDMGYPNGKYFRGNLTCPVSVDVTLDHGYLIDTALYYFKEGTIRAKVYHTKEDSAYYQYSRIPVHGAWGAKNVQRYLETDKLIDFSTIRNGNYQYFYKNEILASEGRIESRSKVGTWKYYDLSGHLYKQVEYDSGYYRIPGTKDSIPYYGKLRMWQPNGKELLYGLIRSNRSRFKCDQEMAVNYETLYYLSLFDRDGKPVIIDGTGPVEEFHNNSEISIRGQLRNGKRYGLWKFYSPIGRLEEMGYYDADGRKTGTWVSGDLEAVPYVENLCSPGATHATIFPDANKTGLLQYPITIQEVMYDKGRSLGGSSTRLIPLY